MRSHHLLLAACTVAALALAGCTTADEATDDEDDGLTTDIDVNDTDDTSDGNETIDGNESIEGNETIDGNESVGDLNETNATTSP